MEERTESQNHRPMEALGWLALGIAGGYAAFRALRKARGDDAAVFDADSVLKSCERAARQLEDRMNEASQIQAS